MLYKQAGNPKRSG